MNNLGWILFVLAVIVILILWFMPEKGSGILISEDSNEVKCELKDSNGRTITITGSSDDPQFERLCQQQQNQQVYVYGYPYYFIRRHHRPHPSTPPPPTP